MNLHRFREQMFDQPPPPLPSSSVPFVVCPVALCQNLNPQQCHFQQQLYRLALEQAIAAAASPAMSWLDVEFSLN